jgi:hypothetical protein
MKKYYVICILGIILGSLILPCSASLSQKTEYYKGEEILIGGYTNYNTDNSVLVQVWPASFGPRGKYEPEMSGGGSVIVPVIKDNATLNKWVANFSPENWTPDTYMVLAEVIGKNYSETDIFTLLETAPVTYSDTLNKTSQSDMNADSRSLK